jgi:hypothetical protein
VRKDDEEKKYERDITVFMVYWENTFEDKKKMIELDGVVIQENNAML